MSIHINIISRGAAQRTGRAGDGRQGQQPALRHDERSDASAKAIGGMSHVFSMATGDDRPADLHRRVRALPRAAGLLDRDRRRLDPALPRVDRRPLLAQPRRGATSRSSEPPSFYWYRNISATFITDHNGIELATGRRRQHDVVERLSAPRQRLAVLAQGRSTTRWPRSRGRARQDRRGNAVRIFDLDG